jgi:microcystin degradation protein MlrC
MSARKCVLLAGLFHETHTFLETRTSLRDFAIRRGARALEAMGDASPLGGALAAACEFDWHIIPAVDLRAMPSGLVEDEVVETFWREVAAVAKPAVASGLDAVYLVLHGAMTAESFPDVEGELLARLRALPGMAALPVFGVFDLHANFTSRMAAHADCLVAYRENPHTDARESAVRAAGLLQRALTSGRWPRTFWRHPPLLWPPAGVNTSLEPMRSLEAAARELESRHPHFWCVNVIAGFSFADVPDAGVSFTVVTDGGEEEARVALDELCRLAWDLRADGSPIDEPADIVVARALRNPVSGLTVIAEPSDNIGGGAPGDGTGLLRVFLKLGVSKAALAMTHAPAVAALRSLTPGARVRLSLGGGGSPWSLGPLDLDVELVSLSHGRFELVDKHSHLASMFGDSFDMGPCAVVRHAGVTILLTSRPTPPMDLGQWTSQGVDVAKLSFLGVKAAVAHRRAYEPIAARMLCVDTPGPCTSRLVSLPFRKIRRPIFPLDAWVEPNERRRADAVIRA